MVAIVVVVAVIRLTISIIDGYQETEVTSVTKTQLAQSRAS
jgi:hypothetical protein